MRVYVVDDEHVIAVTLALILLKNGFAATGFTDPLEALAITPRLAPDFLISDVIMPRLSGIELAIQIRKLCPMCKVLLLSGQAETNDLLAVDRGQGHNFTLLSKPIHPDDLITAITKLQDKSMGRARI